MSTQPAHTQMADAAKETFDIIRVLNKTRMRARTAAERAAVDTEIAAAKRAWRERTRPLLVRPDL